MDIWLASLIVILCLLMSAFFSAGETAFTGTSKARMIGLAEKGDRRAKRVLRILEARERFLGTMLIGNSIVNIGVSSLATSILIILLGKHYGVIAATVIISILVIIFAEILPKTLAIKSPDGASLRMARWVVYAMRILGPLTQVAGWIVKIILRILGEKVRHSEPLLTPSEEIKGQVALLHRQGDVIKDERDMLGGLLDLKELFVSDVMVHRTKMESIDADLPAIEIVRQVIASSHTRLPLWRETQENIVGVLHSKDLLRALSAVDGDASRLKIDEIALETWFVPESTSLQDQLQAFLSKKTHFALVVDEYGEVMGLVTLEDILEEIVGDIADEHDLTVEGVRPRKDGAVIVDGTVPIRDLNRAMDWRLPDEEATTIAGLVIHEARQIPNTGQIFNFYGYRFQVVRKSRNRLTALLITPLDKLKTKMPG
ncbi:HlyC/CorC family transporter [Microvirga sp. W0021]|uniref:HlyC/CorC family transporter n=1 Tax=Hohaiivirga grylli TaxID=3133970 RepID=A0ABV0BNA7_9HYPH